MSLRFETTLFIQMTLFLYTFFSERLNSNSGLVFFKTIKMALPGHHILSPLQRCELSAEDCQLVCF